MERDPWIYEGLIVPVSADVKQSLQQIRSKVEGTQPEDCGSKHEIRLSLQLIHGIQPASGSIACPKSVMERNSMCKHRGNNSTPDPYLTELQQLEEMGILVQSEAGASEWNIEAYEISYLLNRSDLHTGAQTSEVCRSGVKDASDERLRTVVNDAKQREKPLKKRIEILRSRILGIIDWILQA